MDDWFNAILSVAIIPQTIDVIVKRENISELAAINDVDLYIKSRKSSKKIFLDFNYLL